MPDNKELTRLLLISKDQDRADLLARMIEDRGLQAELSLMSPSRSAVARARLAGRFRQASPFDVLLIDFSAPDKGMLDLLADITFGPNRLPTPTVLLTSLDSEALLRATEFAVGDLIMFEPTTLPSFLNKMCAHSRGRFLRALSMLSGIGPILVRLPLHFTRTLDNLPQRHIGLRSA